MLIQLFHVKVSFVKAFTCSPPLGHDVLLSWFCFYSSIQFFIVFVSILCTNQLLLLQQTPITTRQAEKKQTQWIEMKLQTRHIQIFFNVSDKRFRHMYFSRVCGTMVIMFFWICEGKPWSQAFQPVCGEDGTTYTSGCLAKYFGVKADCDGGCPCDGGCVCQEVHQPVCGENGKTYSNRCKATCWPT